MLTVGVLRITQEDRVRFQDDLTLMRLVKDAQAKEKARNRAWLEVLCHMKDEVGFALDPEKAKVVKGNAADWCFYIRSKDRGVKVRVELVENGWAPWPLLFRVRLDTGKNRSAYRVCRDLEEIRKSFKAVSFLFEQQDEEGE